MPFSLFPLTDFHLENLESVKTLVEDFHHRIIKSTEELDDKHARAVLNHQEDSIKILGSCPTIAKLDHQSIRSRFRKKVSGVMTYTVTTYPAPPPATIGTYQKTVSYTHLTLPTICSV